MESRSSRQRGRLVGLDGVRGIAALFVVLHHCFLLSYPGYPRMTGPVWAGFLIYGHFAVVIFIVLSGFSLAVSPARKEWRLGGGRRFAHRRAWRILPPYWAALVFSLVVAWSLGPAQRLGQAPPNGKSVVVYGLLLQDVFGAPSPNGAFWSIAIEAQLYLAFPLLLIIIRRVNALVMLAAVMAVVAPIGVLAPNVSAAHALLRLGPQFAGLFAAGIVAAGVLCAAQRWRRLPWHWFAAVSVIPVIAMIAIGGSVWTVGHFYWVDLSFGPATGMLLAALATGRPEFLVRFLDTRPIRSLGSFSYSLYLIHAPIVVATSVLLVAPRVPAGVPTFLTTLAIGAPLSVLGARLFASVFELPFQRYRTWPALKPVLLARLGALGRLGWLGGLGRSAPQRQPDELAAAVADGSLLATHVHPVHGGSSTQPLLAGETGGANPQ